MILMISMQYLKIQRALSERKEKPAGLIRQPGHICAVFLSLNHCTEKYANQPAESIAYNVIEFRKTKAGKVLNHFNTQRQQSTDDHTLPSQPQPGQDSSQRNEQPDVVHDFKTQFVGGEKLFIYRKSVSLYFQWCMSIFNHTTEQVQYA